VQLGLGGRVTRSIYGCLLFVLVAGCSDIPAGTLETSEPDIGPSEPLDTLDVSDGEVASVSRRGADSWVETEDGLVDAASAQEVSAPEPDVTLPDEPAEPDPTDPMFDPDRLLDVVVTLAPEDWDVLRHQTRTLLSLFGEGCMEGPWESPFTYFSGTVSVDGQVVDNVGVRKKGFLGSMSAERPSLKIKFDKYVDDQRLEGLKRMTLNNSRQDPSLQRQCVAFERYRAAGLVAPRCNWAKITVNGESLGVYVHVDSLKRPFIRRNFPDDSGTLWEGTLSDFRPEWMPSFQQKTNEDTDDASRLWAVLEALEASDEALYDALNAHIDMEQFFTFWAMEVLTGHWDGYAGNTNNFYLYQRPDDDDRFTFIPWGTDGTFQGLGGPKEGQAPPPVSVMTTGALALRLYQNPATRVYYLGRLSALMDSVWDPQALSAQIQARAEWLMPHLSGAAQPAMVESMNGLMGYIAGIGPAIQAELDQGGVDWGPPLRNVLCMSKQGETSASYTTSWGSLNTMDPMVAGTSTFTGILKGETLSFEQFGATAGYGDGEGANQAIAAVFGRRNGVELFILVLQTDKENFVPQSTVPIDWEMGQASLLYMNQAQHQSPHHVGFIANAYWEIDAASQAPGGEVSGSINGELYVWND
jgi:spore coat protein CotH